MKVLSLLDCDSGQKRPVVIDNMEVATVAGRSQRQPRQGSPPKAYHYGQIGKGFAAHGVVKHKADEYVSLANPFVHTNTIEGSFSIFKRGMRGVYQHCSEQHLHRYLAEFDFRYNTRVALGVNDQERPSRALAGVVGKRLTYRGTDSWAEVS